MRRGIHGNWWVALALTLVVGCGLLAPSGALATIGDLTFTGCIGEDLETGCTATNPARVIFDAEAVAISADGSSVYVVANTGSGTGLIDGFSRNTATGVLSFQQCIGDGSVSCTATSPTDALGEPRSVAVSPDGKSVYVASFDAGVVDVFSRDTSTGTLTFTGCIGEESGCTSTTPSKALEGADAVAVSPNGASAYVGAEGSLDVFERNTSTGALTYKHCIGELSGCTSTSPTKAVVGVRSVSVSADGHSVYASNGAFGTLDSFEREASTGALTFESCIGDSGSICADSLPNTALEGAGSVTTSADGLSVYVAANGVPSAGGLVAFTRDTSTGALSYQGCFGQEGGCTATSPLDAVEKPYSVAVSPDGASVYTAAEGPNAVATFTRNTSTGALSYEGCIGNDESEAGCTATSPLDALNDADSVVVSPGGSNVYASSGLTLSTFSRVTLTATCGCSSTVAPHEQPATSPSSSPPPTQPPPSPQSTLATFENQQITLVTPSPLSCTVSAGKLPVRLDSSPIIASKAKRLRFTSAAFFLDKGVRHVHKTTTDVHGHKKITTVVTYAPNATISHLPGTLEIPLAGLKAGSHTLTVKLSYKESERKHGRMSTVTVTKILSARFTVC
jgi:6-phosphogluconolactonase (cycloisomerase 2 family)